MIVKEKVKKRKEQDFISIFLRVASKSLVYEYNQILFLIVIQIGNN
ncbi:hypothetical protein pb186bvf_000677 [Paramecium bursaria]